MPKDYSSHLDETINLIVCTEAKRSQRERVYTNAKRLYNSHLDETMNLTVCTEAKNVCIRMQKDFITVIWMKL